MLTSRKHGTRGVLAAAAAGVIAILPPLLLPEPLHARQDAPDAAERRAGGAQAREVRRAGDPPHVVVYNQELALVIEELTLDLAEGVSRITFTGVAPAIDPTSVLLLTPESAGTPRVLQRTFQPDLVGTDRLLESHVGRGIRLVTRESSLIEGELLSAEEDVVLRRDDGSLAAVPRGAIRALLFPSLPEGLRPRPALTWRIRSDGAASHAARLSYLTGGLSWRADYDLLLGPDSTELDLNGSITIENRSGADFRDAELTLLAGEVHTVSDERSPVAMAADMARMEDRGEAPVESRPFSEYHTYPIPWPVTLLDGRTTGIGFVTASSVPVTKFFTYEAATIPRFPGGRPLADPGLGRTDTTTPVLTMLTFSTGEEGGVGARLPAGRIRIYRENEEGLRLFVGEDRIGHTSLDETVRLRMGAAFDIVGERVRLEHERLGDYGLEETYRITLRNHREAAVEVRVVEHLFRWSNWTLIDEIVNGDPVEHARRDADTVVWRVPVSAGGESVLTYAVRYTWR